MPEFGAWLQQGTPEQCVPQLWEEERQLSPIGSAMYQLLVIQVSIQLSYVQPFIAPNAVESGKLKIPLLSLLY
jgi:hypothetical protein